MKIEFYIKRFLNYIYRAMALINKNPATRGTFIRMNDEREYDEKSH